MLAAWAFLFIVALAAALVPVALAAALVLDDPAIALSPPANDTGINMEHLQCSAARGKVGTCLRACHNMVLDRAK